MKLNERLETVDDPALLMEWNWEPPESVVKRLQLFVVRNVHVVAGLLSAAVTLTAILGFSS